MPRSAFFAVPLLLYAALVASLSLGAAVRRRRTIFVWAGPLMFASHLAYGIGLFRGLVLPKAHTESQVRLEVMETQEGQ